MTQKPHVSCYAVLFTVFLVYGNLLFAGSKPSAAIHNPTLFHLNFDNAKLSLLDSVVSGTTVTYSYSISIIDDVTLKTLSNIKNTHKPGASIGFEFYSFDVDQTGKTLKVSIGNGVSTASNLMNYLQLLLDNSPKSLNSTL